MALGYSDKKEERRIQVENLLEEPVTQTPIPDEESEDVTQVPEEEENLTDSAQDEPANTPVPLRRSTRSTQGQQPDRFGVWINTTTDQPTPQTVSEALKCPEWKLAIDEFDPL